MSELTDSDNDLMGYNTDELERNWDIERRQAIVIEQSSSTSYSIWIICKYTGYIWCIFSPFLIYYEFNPFGFLNNLVQTNWKSHEKLGCSEILNTRYWFW